MDDFKKPGWFFSPPVGPSICNATLDDVLQHVAQDDEHWSREAPATEDDYCRENWAPLVYSDEQPAGLRINAVIYYINRSFFTMSVGGSAITNYSAVKDPETGETLEVPPHWLDAYPVVSDSWDEWLEVSRQGETYRYPLAVAIDRKQLGEIIRCLFESQALYPHCQWIKEMDYARKYRCWFYVGDG